jgi:hypothetical protein
MFQPLQACSVSELMARVRYEIETARDMRYAAEYAIGRARLVRNAVRARGAALPYSNELRRKRRDQILSAVLETAIRSTAANFGNIQLVEPETEQLVIHVERGFRLPFLQFFDRVECGQAACGIALSSGKRVIVHDTANSAIFLGTAALEVLLDADVRAVQSTDGRVPKGVRAETSSAGQERLGRFGFQHPGVET